MFGPSLLVSPVYKYGDRKREVYFPQSAGWYDFYTGKFQTGGKRTMVDAPYERIPLFVRAGSIIPFGPEMQYADEKPAEYIKLYVYQGTDASFSLYEDENVNYNYEQGRYCVIPMTYNETTRQLTIGGKREGEFDGMLKERTFEIINVNSGCPKAFDVKEKGIIVKYNGEEQVIQL